MKPDLIIKNIGVLATPQGNNPLSGKGQGIISIVEDAVVAVREGRITAVGDQELLKVLDIANDTEVIDAEGGLVTPGLVDAHTHLIFYGWRQKELALKLKGVSYLEILKMGGGILNSVNNTRQASLEELVAKGKKSLEIMLKHGTTTCEVKSGYGLTMEDELKALQAVRILNNEHPLDLVPTFLGAHAIPQEYKDKKAEYIKLVKDMIPQIASEKLAEFCDVFCEEGVFDIEESRDILQFGLKYGLIPKIHADEINPLGGSKLAAEVKAASADHLIKATDEGLRAMAEAAVIAVLLPGTSFYLNEDFARARTMIEMGIPVAVSTDFNPGSSPTESLQLIMNMACLKYRMTPEEVLTAVTLNAAASMNRSHLIGTLEKDKQADLVIWDAPDLEYIFYHYGVNLVKTVIKNGKILIRNGNRVSL